ncbi:MAG: hypothetical protein KGN79_09105 [Acidobacteriota bacterium]|nr:hypothetical protein [Acidobacteriota bacterium]
MRVLFYLLGVLAFCGMFWLGRLMTARGQRWEDENQHGAGTRKIFLYGGRIFQVVGLVWGFLDAVAVVVLGSAISFQ